MFNLIKKEFVQLDIFTKHICHKKRLIARAHFYFKGVEIKIINVKSHDLSVCFMVSNNLFSLAGSFYCLHWPF